MRADVNRFAGEIVPPTLFVSPMVDQDIGTLRGAEAWNQGTRQALRDYINQEPTHTDGVEFVDVREGFKPSVGWTIDRFQDATGGADPGKPRVQYRTVEPKVAIEDLLEVDMANVRARLDRFYAMTGMRARPSIEGEEAKKAGDATWGGDANKFWARVRVPEKNPLMRSFLHELGHCALPQLGLHPFSETTVDGDTGAWSINTNWAPVSGGLSYGVEDGSGGKGTIMEEAVAEGLGTLANRRLRLVRTRLDDEIQTLPEMVAPYIVGGVPLDLERSPAAKDVERVAKQLGIPLDRLADSSIRTTGHSGAAPAAVALELIAKEIGMPSDRYFRMLVDYAKAGVYNPDARQEVAETVYRGTRGKLTLSQIEELPYPVNREASLALLWAVEDAQDVPDHERYSHLFWPPTKRPSNVVVGNATASASPSSSAT